MNEDLYFQPSFFDAEVAVSARKRTRAGVRTNSHKKVDLSGQITIFDIASDMFIPKKRKPAGTIKPKQAQSVTRHKRVSKSKKWIVTSKYLDDGRIEVFNPEETCDDCNECGWSSKEYNGYTEFSDIFETEKSARAFIKGLFRDYPGLAFMGDTQPLEVAV